MKLVIDQKREIADNIVEFEVRDAAGRALPPFTPGAHVSVTGPGGLVRKYSLCNRPGEQDLYRFAVKREAEGRGGSRAIVDDTTLARARAAGIDPAAYLADNDSTGFFEAIGDLVAPGPTFTNVNDLRVILVD